jgi:predicted HTH transcriptional regulator
MKLEHYKPRSARAARRKEKPKRKGNISTRRSLMLAVAQKWKPITSPQLREAYSTKIEWVRKRIPNLRK